MKYKNLKGSLILCFAALLWGLAFVAQTNASAVPSFLINCLRSYISVPFLYIVYRIVKRKNPEPVFPKSKSERKTVITGAIICGIFLAISVNFQQFGIAFYPDGAAVEAHSGFITALYVIIVPMFSLFLKRKISPLVWVSVVIALVGFYLLCFKSGLDGFYFADLLVFVCAICFSLHILAVDKFVGAIGGIRLSMLQFLVCGTVSGILSLIFETQNYNGQILLSAMPYILYLGIMSSGVAYTLQIIGQKYAEPAFASLSMSLESVFAAIGGALAGNLLSDRELIGCAVVFAAIILAQIPELIANKKEKA